MSCIKIKLYLESSHYINWKNPAITKQAAILSKGVQSAEHIAKQYFEFVRDEIKHSWDYKLNPVTCIASDVLKHRTSYCNAKSHLLAALLRASTIPAGLCYQRLTIEDNQPPFCLHGLNAIYLQDYGWYRVDPRGNKTNVMAVFNPPAEKLAFPIVTKGEADLPDIWSEPLPTVTNVLEHWKNHQEVADNLPDLELLERY